MFFHTHQVALDITITHIQCESYANTQAHRPGHPVEQAAAAKRKYPPRLFDSTTLFMPFAIDDFGHIGDAGWVVLEQLAAYAAANTAGGHRDFRLGMTEAQVRDYYLS